MAPKRASKQQQQLNVDQYTLLKKPMEHLGKQLNVPGSFWQGRMSEDEQDKIYKCTIVDFSLAQKVARSSVGLRSALQLVHKTMRFVTLCLMSSSGGSSRIPWGTRSTSERMGF